MNGGAIIQAALVDALRGDAGMAGVTVFDAPPLRGAMPYAIVEHPVLGDIGSKDMTGRDGRIAIVLHDAGERPTRLRAMIDVAETVATALPATLNGGWRLTAIRLARSRIVKAGGDRWIASVELTVRLWRVG